MIRSNDDNGDNNNDNDNDPNADNNDVTFKVTLDCLCSIAQGLFLLTYFWSEDQIKSNQITYFWSEDKHWIKSNQITNFWLKDKIKYKMPRPILSKLCS